MSEWIRRCGRLSLFLAVTFTAVTAYSYRQSSAVAARNDAWRSARLAATRIDASQPGEVQLDFPTGLPDGPHGVMVYLDPGTTEPPLPFPQGEVVLSEQGHASFESALSNRFREDQRDGNGYLLCWNLGSRQPDTRVTIRIAEGSPAWSGLNTVVYAKYWLCGLESVPVALWALTACVAGLIAATSWGMIAWRLARDRHDLPPLVESQPTDAEPSDGAESR
jgi:hypothetical protein